MSTTTVPTAARINARAIFPSLKYDNAPRAIDFLCSAFGFEKYALFPGTAHIGGNAQLKLGSNYVMVGSTTTDTGPISTPAALAGAIGGIVVLLASDADVDAHFARARAAGATIMVEPEPSTNGRAYTVSDSEGYVWNFSSSSPD